MRPFKIRDLMIDVLPDAGLERVPVCRGVTQPDCGAVSVEPFPIGCNVTICPNVTRCIHVTLVADTCPAASYCTCGDITNFSKGCGGGTTCAMPEEHVQFEELSILKAQLLQSLKNIEARQLALDARLRPQTLDEIQGLEAQLTAALQELQTRKTELQRDAGKKAK